MPLVALVEACLISTAGAFDLYHFGAEIGKNQRSGRSGNNMTKFDNFDASKWAVGIGYLIRQIAPRKADWPT